MTPAANATIAQLFAAIRGAHSKWGGGEQSGIRYDGQPEGDTMLYVRWDDERGCYVIRSYA